MGNNGDPRYNASGCLDLTAYDAIERVLAEETKAAKQKKDKNAKVGGLIRTIHKLAHKAGFEVEGRIVLKDKTTGKIWR